MEQGLTERSGADAVEVEDEGQVAGADRLQAIFDHAQ
jgi:hypothetical protein